MTPRDLGEPIEPHKLEPGTVYYFFDGMHYYQKKVDRIEATVFVTDDDGSPRPTEMKPYKINSRNSAAAAPGHPWGGRRTKHRKQKRRRSSRRI